MITFVGGGNMASALIGGLVANGWPSASIRVVDIDAAARERLSRERGIATYFEVAPALAGVECVLIAVKPQDVRPLALAIRPLLADTLVVTIAAGIRLKDLSRWLGGFERLVRAMPNTPAVALTGMTGLYAGPRVSAQDRAYADRLLSAAGKTLWVEREELLDGVTAVSGSGPAYVFYFIECLQDAARTLGFDEQAARLLAIQTFAGASRLASESAENAALLRARVTSKGGTTERALGVLENASVREAIARAVVAAAERARELGDTFGDDPSEMEP